MRKERSVPFIFINELPDIFVKLGNRQIFDGMNLKLKCAESFLPFDSSKY